MTKNTENDVQGVVNAGELVIPAGDLLAGPIATNTSAVGSALAVDIAAVESKPLTVDGAVQALVKALGYDPESGDITALDVRLQAGVIRIREWDHGGTSASFAKLPRKVVPGQVGR